MKYCHQCSVSIQDSDQKCPLCQNTLSGLKEPNSYPTIPILFAHYSLLFKILAFISLSIVVICLIINLSLVNSGYWSVFVILGVIYFWTIFLIALREKNRLFKNIFWQTFLISFFSIIFDFATGWHGWSLNFFLPIASATALLILNILTLTKKIVPEHYLIYTILVIFLGILPMILLLMGLITISLPTNLCLGISLLTFFKLIIFNGRDLLAEIYRRFHI